MGRNNKKKHAKHKQAKPSTSQGGGAIAGQPPRHDDKMQQGKPAYLASSTEGAPPAPPSLVTAVQKGDEAKVKKVFKKLTFGGGKGNKGKGRKKKGSKAAPQRTSISAYLSGSDVAATI